MKKYVLPILIAIPLVLIVLNLEPIYEWMASSSDQDTFLECNIGDEDREPFWYSFNASVDGPSSGYVYSWVNPRVEETLFDVNNDPSFVYFKRHHDTGENILKFRYALNRKTGQLRGNEGVWLCKKYSASDLKDRRLKYYDDQVKNRKY